MIAKRHDRQDKNLDILPIMALCDHAYPVLLLYKIVVQRSHRCVIH